MGVLRRIRDVINSVLVLYSFQCPERNAVMGRQPMAPVQPSVGRDFLG